ncbi:MAG TPA: UbiD family decarboxylase domain-containing protein, partial [Verrucomicrobiae bacterium]
MAFDSFRDFVNALDRAGELKRITQPVATELEITEIADREMKQPGGGKALLFEKPTINGVLSPFPVAVNTMGSYKRMAMSMGAESVEEVANELGALMKAKPPTSFKDAIKLLSLALDLRHAKPKTVSSGSCKDVIHRFDSPASATTWPTVGNWRQGTNPQPPTLANIPILKCWPLDGCRFITLPCVVTKDPDTGERNV